MENFDYGSVAAAKLQSIFGVPEVRKFADIQLLEFGARD